MTPLPASVEAVQVSVTLVAPTVLALTLVGTLGGVVSSDGRVVTDSELLGCDRLPAASRAFTTRSYAVFGFRFSSTVSSWLPPTDLTSVPPS